MNIVITGSTKGIGLGLATEFARQGHKVVISGRNKGVVEACVSSLSNMPGKVYGCACDVSVYEQVKALWDFADQEMRGVDIWINNAGLARTVWPIVETPANEIHAMIHTNMLGMTYGSQVAAKGFLIKGRGKIFNMLGGGSDGEIFPGMGIYGTTKRGLDYFTNALTKELKDSGIIVGKIRPGMIITEGVIREAKADLENFEKSRKTMNNLVDTIDNVAPFLVEKILNTEKTGTKIRWLNGQKIALRMLKARFKDRPDQFAQFGL